MSVVLHQFPQSHFCIRLRWTMALKKIAFTVKNYELSGLDELQKLTGEYRKLPVLEYNGKIICDSPVIARFLEENHPAPSIYPGFATPARCDMVAGWVDTKVMLTAAKLMVKDYLVYVKTDTNRARYRQIFKAAHGMEPEETFERRGQYAADLAAHWALLEESLNKSPFIFGTEVSYADLAVASRLKLLNMVMGYELPTNLERSRKWYQQISSICD